MNEEMNILIVPYEKLKEMMALDVSHLAETRLGLVYLPWAEAELLLREHFPTLKVDSEIVQYKMGDVTYVMVEASLVDVSTGKRTYPEHFPIMDGSGRRQSIPNPGTRDISDAIKRAGVKLIARETGIGLNLYRKEKDDLPSEQGNLRQSTNNSGKSEFDETTEPPRRSFTRKIV